MKMLPSDPDTQTIVARIDSGDLDLQPNFQRGEVWTTAKKRKLIDSILRDWHIPPIHVVVGENGKQEVLDGQQRLVAIRDFVRGIIKVDGTTEPLDPAIEKLSDFSYSQLPPDAKRAFDQFTIRVFRLTDYEPGEPGELFFRLNQMTYLTAAEQRNAFFGPVREQVRSLVEQFESSPAVSLFGFSNRRMAYDDVLARLLCTLESKTLGTKLGAAEISSRFRSTTRFSNEVLALASHSIDLLIEALNSTPLKLRFNKATLFTWLVFVSHFTGKKEPVHGFASFLADFEGNRTKISIPIAEYRRHQITKFSPATERNLLRIFSDRSSSRVSDVSSVLFRDVILWLFYFTGASSETSKLLSKPKFELLRQLNSELSDRKESTEEVLENLVSPGIWGEL
jgi:Protein of unknown function DUF262